MVQFPRVLLHGIRVTCNDNLDAYWRMQLSRLPLMPAAVNPDLSQPVHPALVGVRKEPFPFPFRARCCFSEVFMFRLTLAEVETGAAVERASSMHSSAELIV